MIILTLNGDRGTSHQGGTTNDGQTPASINSWLHLQAKPTKRVAEWMFRDSSSLEFDTWTARGS